jgi:membrane associated rhomboid family serine protease
MAPGADLFVVCKNCGSEVSPYITECPYCGHRLRRRAPKIPRPGDRPPRPGRRRLFGRRGSRGAGQPAPEEAFRRAPRPVLAATIADRPYATIALVAASCVLWVLLRAGYVSPARVVVVGPLHGDWWKLLSSQFSYLNGWYALFTLLVIAIFGWLLEQRFGALVVVVLFLAAGAAGALVALAVYPVPIVLGANAGALALLAAWAAPDLRAARSGRYYEGDLLGAGALAALILAIPFVRPEASWLAGVTGAAIGLLAALGLETAGRAEV